MSEIGSTGGESPSKSDAVTSAVREEVAASDDARPGGHE